MVFFSSNLIVAAHRRTQFSWPHTTEEYAFVWKAASDLALFSRHTLYASQDGAYATRDFRGFTVDAAGVFEEWEKLKVETEDDVAAALVIVDKGWDDPQYFLEQLRAPRPKRRQKGLGVVAPSPFS